MPFPASNQGSADAYRLLKGRANSVRNESSLMRSQSLAGPVSAQAILNYVASLARAKTEMGTLASAPGIAAYAQAQEGNPGLDIAAEYATMIGRVDATVEWVVANLPQDASGYKLVFTMIGNGSVVYRSFDTTSLAGFRTVLDQLIATIS